MTMAYEKQDRNHVERFEGLDGHLIYQCVYCLAERSTFYFDIPSQPSRNFQDSFQGATHHQDASNSEGGS
jgi:hypothetical protein